MDTIRKQWIPVSKQKQKQSDYVHTLKFPTLSAAMPARGGIIIATIGVTADIIAAVSYTHLDVYKRQVHVSAPYKETLHT